VNSSPRSSSRARRYVALLVTLVLVACMATACTAPGAGRVLDKRKPKGLPKALHFVPGDAMGWMLLDTDAGSRRWAAIDGATGEPTSEHELDSLFLRVFGADLDRGEMVDPWIGASAGVALMGVDVDAPDSQLAFAEVRSRGKLERALRDGGWVRAKRQLGGGDLAGELTLYEPKAHRDAPRLATIAISDDVLLAAASTKGLEAILADTDEYAADERKATSDYTVTALSRVPAAIVFRSDIIRDQARRFVADDPALLEVSAWLVRTPFVSAMRDGWIGLAPPTSAQAGSGDIRIVGSFDWLKDIADPVRPKPAPAALLNELPGDTTAAIALHNPGQYGASVIDAITGGGSSFATKLDGTTSTSPVQLFDVLDSLNGDAGIAFTERGVLEARVRSADADKVAQDVNTISRDLKLPALSGEARTGAVVVRASIPPTTDADVMDVIVRSDATDSVADLAAAGKPPRTPVAWLWLRDTDACGKEDAAPADGAPQVELMQREPDPIAGWVTYDGTIRMSISLAMPVEAIRCASDAPRGFQSLFLD